jgi:hypothetical protein
LICCPIRQGAKYSTPWNAITGQLPHHFPKHLLNIVCTNTIVCNTVFSVSACAQGARPLARTQNNDRIKLMDGIFWQEIHKAKSHSLKGVVCVPEKTQLVVVYWI